MPSKRNLLQELDHLTPQQLKRLLVEQLTQKKLGLYWESNAIERDKALNANLVLPRLVEQYSHWPDRSEPPQHLIIEGDNFDSLRLLNATHRGKIRVILIDPPYNTGNKDWVYNDHYVGGTDRWRHSQWLEFLHRRLILARDLLTSDGVILVTINDENRARLELLMDEVFPGRRIGSLVWRTKDTGNDLSQRFSHVHEHVLVYANAGFKFNGRPTDRGKFRNPDNDERGDWSPQPLTANKTLFERPNTYYPIQNPATGYWYPCDPDSTWRFASEKEIRRRLGNEEQAVQAVLAGLRSRTIEQLIEEQLIYFPPCTPAEVMQFDSREALLNAIKQGKGPILPKKKTPLLREDLPDLEFWVGKPIAPGRPSRKEHWTARPEQERLAPLSSWIAGLNEELDELDEFDALILRSARGGVATEEVKNLLGSKAFPYPKPLSLIRGLLEQATRPGDIVLDFFAGAGTTGHAVLDLNAEDGGKRHFILCSNTEANAKEPDKNLCRDACAQRIGKVIAGSGSKPGLGGQFAYLQLDLLDIADLPFDMAAEHAALLLGMREQNAIVAPSTDSVRQIAGNGEVAVLLCTQVNTESLEAISAWPAQRLVVYSSRPDTVRERLAAADKGTNSYSLQDALLRGQTSWRMPGRGAAA